MFDKIVLIFSLLSIQSGVLSLFLITLSDIHRYLDLTHVFCFCTLKMDMIIVLSESWIGLQPNALKYTQPNAFILCLNGNCFQVKDMSLIIGGP